MTLLSRTECCRLLGIDAKTLHRWLAQAQLSLHADPADGRRKALTPEQLRLLAKAHHRSLPALPGELPALASGEALALPADLLALLRTLPEHLAALQQQLADLSLRLPGAQPPAQAVGRPTGVRRALARSRQEAASKQKRPTPVIPRVEYVGQGHYVVICPKRGLLSLEPESPAWVAWLAEQSSFRFVGKEGHFTAHHAWRVKKGAWRAHRHLRNHSYTLRLAPTQELTIAVLEQAAQALQAHLK